MARWPLLILAKVTIEYGLMHHNKEDKNERFQRTQRDLMQKARDRCMTNFLRIFRNISRIFLEHSNIFRKMFKNIHEFS